MSSALVPMKKLRTLQTLDAPLSRLPYFFFLLKLGGAGGIRTHTVTVLSGLSPTVGLLRQFRMGIKKGGCLSIPAYMRQKSEALGSILHGNSL